MKRPTIEQLLYFILILAAISITIVYGKTTYDDTRMLRNQKIIINNEEKLLKR